MKKFISIILVVLTVFSITATMAFAEETAEKPVKVTFLDDNGSTLDIIYVDYGEDYTKKAPKNTYTDGGYKYYISGWETTHPAFTGTVYEGQLPPIGETDKISEITFKASYSVEEITAGGVIGDAVDGIFGENTTSIFEALIQQIKDFIQQFILFLRNFA